MKTALVMSGAGAKGTIFAAAERVFHDRGFTWDYIVGTSAGALCAAMLAYGRRDRLKQLWLTTREKDVYDKVGWLKLGWRLLVQKKSGLYSNERLGKLIRKELGAYVGKPPSIEAECAFVDLVSGATCYASVADLSAVWASATIPILWESLDGRYVDGGVREVTPLARAIDRGCDRIVVLLGNSVEVPPSHVKGIKATALRTTELMVNEIFRNDLARCESINRDVKMGEDDGTHRHIELIVMEPTLDDMMAIGDGLDFSEGRQTKRWLIGTLMAKRVLGTPA